MMSLVERGVETREPDQRINESGTRKSEPERRMDSDIVTTDSLSAV